MTLSQFVLRWAPATRWIPEHTVMAHQTIQATVHLVELPSSGPMHLTRKSAMIKPADRRYSE